MRKKSNRINQEKLSSLKLKNKNYHIIPINSQKEASKYSGYTSWCITTMMDQWENYTRFGRRFYFLLKDGFENVPRPADPEAVGAPFDEYGLSMISVLVDMEGEPAYVTTRYNHEFNGENNPDLHTAEQVQNITGINFYRELKPYTREELHSMGIIPFDEVPELLASGQNIYEMFDEMEDWNDEFYQVSLNNRYNLLNKQSNTLLYRRWYDDIHYPSDGLVLAELNDKFGFIDTTGRVIIPFKYASADNLFEGLARVQLNGKCGFIDKSCREVIPCKYNEAYSFSEGLARVRLNRKWGCIDKTGREVIPFKYDWVWDFSNGLAPVKLNDRWGFIDKTGREVIPCEYDYVFNFSGRLARAQLNDKWGYIDKQGNWYNEKPTILPESINKITVSDIRYMVNECINRLR